MMKIKYTFVWARRLALAATLGLTATAARAQSVLFSEPFSYPDGVVSSEFSNGNPNWDMNSGTLYAKGGRGWTGSPNTSNNSVIFRMDSRRTDYRDVEVSLRLANNGFTTSSRTPAKDFDGVHLWLRYASEASLYALSVNRRDGDVIIKKKVPGGSSNGGTYYNLTPEIRRPFTLSAWQSIKALALNNADGSVTLKVYINGTLALSAVDRGTGGAPIRVAGRVGVRGDNCNFYMDDLVVTSLSGSGSAAAAPLLSAVSATNVTPSGATIVWQTNRVSNSQIEYGKTTAYGTQTPASTATGLYHSVALTGLTPGTLYHYRAKSTVAGATGVSGDFTFTTAAQPAAMVISAVAATGIMSNGATITWITDKVSNSQVEYGKTTAYGTQSYASTATGLYHSMQLTGLTPGTLYHYRAKSAANGVVATSGNFTFTTAGAPTPTAAPPAPVGAPVLSNVVSGNLTPTSAFITWQTNTVSRSQVEYGKTTAYGTQSYLSSASGLYHSMQLNGLTPGTVYHYRAKSPDAQGRMGVSGDFTFTTPTQTAASAR